MIVAIYKKKGPTSRKVLNDIKQILGEKKIGHAGTLDPLAEGVLVVGIGRESTKKLHSAEFNEKEYLATIMLGKYSTTEDEEGEKTEVENITVPSKEEVKKVLASFSGKKVMQTPPAFSAVKVKGKEAYKWARKGKFVPLSPRKAEIKNITLLSYKYPLIKLEVVTGRGVYIRSLARDIGKKLSVGGYLYSLKRTRVGNFSLEDCVDLSFFKD